MPRKDFEDAELGAFSVTRRKGARKITLSISKRGLPNVTIPVLAPYSVGVAFARKQADWIARHKPDIEQVELGSNYELYDGTHLRVIKARQKNSTKKSTGMITVAISDTPSGHKYFKATIDRLLAEDTKNAVESRLPHFATQLEVAPSELRYRATTSRWGSCSSKKQLTFSVYLAQLPNELIDYVIIHELSHIREMNHQPAFWRLVASLDPNYKQHRKELKQHELRAYFKKIVS